MRKQIYIIVAVFLLGVLVIQAQEKDNIGTEVVNVVKAYKPSISDAFKIKQVPKLNDSVTLKKKKIKYSIFSVPVASTFTPAKGKASTVQKVKRDPLYNSYASVGLGNFNSALLDFYTSRELNRDERLDLGFNHHSSHTNINDALVDTKFFNTNADISYVKSDRDFTWGADARLQHQIYSWYGVPKNLFTADEISNIDEKQKYYNIYGAAHITMDDSFFKGGELVLRRFWDGLKSAENRVILTPEIEVPIADELVTVGFKLDYVGGKFERDLGTTNEIKYSQFQAGVSPSLVILRDDLTVNLGASIVFGVDMEHSESKMHIYPQVKASYRLVDEYVIAYGGIEGGLTQNSYYGFVNENPYVSPTLFISPTDKQYDAYVGVKGKLLANLSYNLKGGYKTEKNKALFQRNLMANTINANGYAYGNSFGVVYDDVNTISVFGELNLDINRNFTLGVNAEVFDYNTESENPAWNLPDITGSIFMDYQIDKHWYMGSNIFFVGQRKDLTTTTGILLRNTVTLDSYFDLNAHVGYRFNSQLSAFVKGNNLSNNEYTKWSNYQVQGLQVLAGATYKFDF